MAVNPEDASRPPPSAGTRPNSLPFSRRMPTRKPQMVAPGSSVMVTCRSATS